MEEKDTPLGIPAVEPAWCFPGLGVLELAATVLLPATPPYGFVQALVAGSWHGCLTSCPTHLFSHREHVFINYGGSSACCFVVSIPAPASGKLFTVPALARHFAWVFCGPPKLCKPLPCGV